MTVSVRRDGDCAIVTIDNPPVNALSQSVRQGLVDGVEPTHFFAEVAFLAAGLAAAFLGAALAVTALPGLWCSKMKLLTCGYTTSRQRRPLKMP